MAKMLRATSLKIISDNKDTLLRDVDEKLQLINKESGETKDSISFVMTSIYKLSILLSYQVFLKENQQVFMRGNEIEESIYLLGDILKYQIKICKYNHVVLSQREMIENFEMFENISSHVLNTLIVKQHYLVLLFSKYFNIDSKWEIQIEELICNLAKVSRSYCNAKAFINRHRENRRDMGVIENSIKKAFALQQRAVQQVSYTWAKEKNSFHGNVVMQYWESSFQLYKLFEGKSEVEKLKVKIEGIRQRINQDSQKDSQKE